MCFKCLVVVMGFFNPFKAIYIMHMLQGYDVAEWCMPITRSSLIKSNIRCISHCAYSLATRCQFLLKYVTSYTNIFAFRYLYKYLFQICNVLNVKPIHKIIKCFNQDSVADPFYGK